MIPPLETHPPRDPSGGLVYQFTSGLFCLQRKHLPLWVILNIVFYGEVLLAPRPTPQAGGPPLVGCPRLLIQFIHSYPPYWRPFFHPQPEDAPCRGDRDPYSWKCMSLGFWNCPPAPRKCKCRRKGTSPRIFKLRTRWISRGGAVGSGTALQTERPRLLFPMMSLEFFIDIILQAALWPWGWLGF